MRESWTDARLDDFRSDTAGRFDAVDRRLESIEAELKAIQRVMMLGTIALTSVIIAGFAAMIGLIATQL